MSNAAPITNADVKAFVVANAIPNGYQYTLVDILLNKRLLRADMPANERLKILEGLEGADQTWLTRETIAAVEPLCAKGYEIASEALKLNSGKALDVFSDHFATFASLNPSLIAALEMLPGCGGRMAVLA
jgi:hypothetical protein